MSKPIPIIWSPIKNQFVKMGAGDGGILVTPADMTIMGNAQLIPEAPYGSYDNKVMVAGREGKIFSKFDEMRAGLYSVTFRISWSTEGGEDLTNLYNNNESLCIVNVYSVNNLGQKETDIATSSIRIRDFDQFGGNKFGCQNFGTLGFVFNYKNNSKESESIVVEFDRGSQYNYAISIDYTIMSNVLSGIYSLPVIEY